MKLTLVTAAFLLASHGACTNLIPNAHVHVVKPRDFLSSIKSFFDPGDDGDDDGPTTSPKSPKTTAQVTTTKKVTTTAAVTTTKVSLNPTPAQTTESKDATSTNTSSNSNTSTITSSASLTTPTATPSSSATPAPISPEQPPPQKPTTSISPAGIAVAVIFSIVIFLLIAWLIFRYHPKCRAWYLARQEEQYKQRTHRANLGAAGLSRSRTGLQSFFAPRAQTGSSIKRKTIQWGAPSKRATPDLEQNGLPAFIPPTRNENGTRTVQRGYSNASYDHAHSHGEKVPLAELASPMGMDRRYDVSPVVQQQPPPHSHSPSHPYPYPYQHPPMSNSSISPMSRSATQTGGALPASPSIISQMNSPTTTTTNNNNTAGAASPNPSRKSKALPHVKINGQVVYELA